jgi:mono/diheme cytochrome c family protein
MPPKKSKPEPDVVVPEGDSTNGRAIFDQHCAACHALEGDNKTASAPTLGLFKYHILIYFIVELLDV